MDGIDPARLDGLYEGATRADDITGARIAAV
jgi:hypothetical protein